MSSFKNGAFRIADKTGAMIVPVSIGNLYKHMPPGSIGPLSRIKNSYVMIHPPIDPKNKSVKEMKALCYKVRDLRSDSNIRCLMLYCRR